MLGLRPNLYDLFCLSGCYKCYENQTSRNQCCWWLTWIKSNDSMITVMVTPILGYQNKKYKCVGFFVEEAWLISWVACFSGFFGYRWSLKLFISRSCRFFSQGIVKILGCPAEGQRCSQYPRAWQWCRPQYTSSSFDQMIMMNHHLPSTKLTVVDKKICISKSGNTWIFNSWFVFLLCFLTIIWSR